MTFCAPSVDTARGESSLKGGTLFHVRTIKAVPRSRGRSRPRNTRALRVVIADDHRILLESLHAVLASRGFAVLGVAENGRLATILVRDRRPDVVVLDASMPVMSGVEAARQILRYSPDTGIVLLTGYGEDRVVHEGLRLGVRGFVVRAQGVDDLMQAIRDVSQGAIYISACYSRSVLREFAQTSARATPVLTSREEQVLRLIAEGQTMKQTAGVLTISVRTAEGYRASIMRKLSIRDTAGLVRYAIREGLVVA